MKNYLALFGLTLVLLSSNLYVYSKGLVDGKLNYQKSPNMLLTLDSAYRFGLHEGQVDGFFLGYAKGAADCKAEFLKLSRKQKRKWCK